AEAALDVFGLVLPVTDSVMRRMTDLVLRFPNLSARDLVHVATCADARIDIIVSPDRAFDEVAGLERIDPLEVDILL
ncbi:MAG: hypothetical protein OEM97_11340, partial [Acidimicrobiia bacterium]|nr:hypothetical protein [Acidimicrobiia bacterium]